MALSKESQNRVISAIDEDIFYTFALQPWLLTTWEQSLGNLGSLRISRKGLKVGTHETKIWAVSTTDEYLRRKRYKKKKWNSVCKRWQRWPPASGWCGRIWSPGGICGVQWGVWIYCTLWRCLCRSTTEPLDWTMRPRTHSIRDEPQVDRAVSSTWEWAKPHSLVISIVVCVLWSSGFQRNNDVH